jgi:DNA-binding response OmpR family regulator
VSHPSKSKAVRVHETELRVGSLLLDLARHQAFSHGQPISLTRLEFALLRHLLTNAHRVVTVDELVGCVIEGIHRPGSSLVRVHICHLRRKLGYAGAAIRTIRGVGLCLDESWLEANRYNGPKDK